MTDLDKIKYMNKMICDVDFTTDNNIDLCKFIAKLSSYDWNTSFGLLTRYFINWYNANPRLNEMGEDDFLEGWLTRCLANSTSAEPGTDENIDQQVKKIFKKMRTKGSYQSAINKILKWTDQEETDNIKKFMPKHWYEPIHYGDIEGIFDGATELLSEI